MTNSSLVLAVADQLKVSDLEEIHQIDASITPVLVNSAINSGNLDLLKKFHKEGADLDRVDYTGRTALHVVAGNPSICNKAVTTYIVHQKEVNLDQLDKKGRSPLFIALECDNFPVAEILVKNGAHVIASDKEMARLLCQCGNDGDLKSLQILIEAHTNLNVSDYDKRNLGHLAAAEGHWEFIQTLLNAQVFDFEAQDRWDQSTVDQIKQYADCEGKTKTLAKYAEFKAMNKVLE